MRTTSTRDPLPALLTVLALVALLVMPHEVAAQDRVLEALREQRLRARTAAVLSEIGFRPETFGPQELVHEWKPLRRFSASTPTIAAPTIQLPPVQVRPVLRRSEDEVVVINMDQLNWRRVPGGEEDAFVSRFGEHLWTNAAPHARTPLDTMATQKVRALLNSAFGQPTRTAVPRGGGRSYSGSPFIQFEYWFVVNDEIPFVVMDRDGPFGRGLTMVASEDHVEFIPRLVADLADRLQAIDRLMPYVDYFQSRESRQWYRAGFDGEQYYVIQIERPRWAPRDEEPGGWYDFR